VYWVNTIVQGALVGGLYALFATGLSLMFGVMRIINIAHGDLIVLSAYLAVVVVEVLGVDPLGARVEGPIVGTLVFFVLRFLLADRGRSRRCHGNRSTARRVWQT
jgi:branched-chain amino acid transport system permease protein